MITVNGIQVTPTTFPDNTSQIWKLPDQIIRRRWAFVEWDFTHEGEFMHLAQLKDLLDHSGVDANLKLNFLPYGRQDKEINNDNTFALRTFARILNELKFNKVSCLDPHSEVADKLIKNFIRIEPVKYINNVKAMVKPELLAYPDQGAQIRYSKIFEDAHVYAKKVRNQTTGEIERLELIGDVNDKSVLIVDDICDGGATFIRLAAHLYAQGAKDVNLYVTHGIFSRGLKPLNLANIKRIFTKDGEAFTYPISYQGPGSVYYQRWVNND